MYSIYTIHAYLNKLCFVASKTCRWLLIPIKKKKWMRKSETAREKKYICTYVHAWLFEGEKLLMSKILNVKVINSVYTIETWYYYPLSLWDFYPPMISTPFLNYFYTVLHVMVLYFVFLYPKYFVYRVRLFRYLKGYSDDVHLICGLIEDFTLFK